MKFEDYQSLSKRTAIYPKFLLVRKDGTTVDAPWVYPVIGKAGEAGEISEKIKKLARDNDGIINDEFETALIKELGDLLWYIAQICNEFDISMDRVAETNIQKLEDRKQRNAIIGDGDNR